VSNIGFDPDRIKQEPEGQEVYGSLKEAYRKEMSRTWKERHAKGVPAVASTTDQCREWRALTDHSKRRKTNLWHVCPYESNRQNPELSVSIPMVWAGEMDEFNDWVIVAQFCNFRYKQSWLDKNPSIWKQIEDGTTEAILNFSKKGGKNG
jgi:DNA primase